MGSEMPKPSTARRRYVPLQYRVAAVNVLLLAVAVAATALLLAPGRLSSLRADVEGAVVVLVLLALVGADVYLVRRVVAPLQALTSLARRVDLSGSSERMPAAAPTSEAGELAQTFNEMLDRLEVERRDATGRVLAGQESERLRIAQELHDQIGQELTAVLLTLARIERRAPDALEPDVREVQDAVRASLHSIRRIAIELRPEALDELGLESALAVLCERFEQAAGLEVTQEVDPDLPTLRPEAELVVYRVAQEALTNVARHSGAERAQLSLVRRDGALRLTVRDRGRGLEAANGDGTGMRGMRERAALIGASLTVETDPDGGGCRVRLDVPIEERRSPTAGPASF